MCGVRTSAISRGSAMMSFAALSQAALHL